MKLKVITILVASSLSLSVLAAGVSINVPGANVGVGPNGVNIDADPGLVDGADANNVDTSQFDDETRERIENARALGRSAKSGRVVEVEDDSDLNNQDDQEQGEVRVGHHRQRVQHREERSESSDVEVGRRVNVHSGRQVEGSHRTRVNVGSDVRVNTGATSVNVGAGGVQIDTP